MRVDIQGSPYGTWVVDWDPDDEDGCIHVMVPEHDLPGNEDTDDGTLNFVERRLPIVDGVADWEAMLL